MHVLHGLYTCESHTLFACCDDRHNPNNNMEKEENPGTGSGRPAKKPAGKKKMGRPSVLSSSTKKKRKAVRMKAYRTRNKALWLEFEVHGRWFALAKQMQVAPRDLAVMLLDHAAAGSDLIGSDSKHGTSHFDPPMSSTPATFPPLPDRNSAESSGGAVYMSSISGVDSLKGTPTVVSSDDPPEAVRESEKEFDVSVCYKVKGEFVYPEDLELDDDLQDQDFDVEAEFSLMNRDCSGLQIICSGDEVFGAGDEEEEDSSSDANTTRSGLHQKVEKDEEAASSRFHLVEEGQLRRLAAAFHSVCPVCHGQPLALEIVPSGTAGHIHWTCPAGHKTEMCTQRTVNRVHTGDLKMSAGIVLSGNNYVKISMLASQVGCGMPSSATFHRIQRKYICPAVNDLAESMIAQNVAKHAAKDGIVIMGDGRNDSPGHTAQYLTYLFLEAESGDVVHASFKDKRQTGGSSVKMEPVAFFEGLADLKEKGVKVQEVVTDAHPVITAQMRIKHPTIKHSHDTWHGGKNLGKKLTKICGKAANRPLIPWVKDVVNHWWFCSETCQGDPHLFREKWRGLLHHVVDEHEWSLGSCEHEELPGERKPYLHKGSQAQQALAEVALDRTLLKKIPYYVNFRHTGELESINNHILMYCSKRFAFRYPAYKCRNNLALVDYQHHKDREVLLDADGNEKYRARWSRRANDYVAVKCRARKQYSCIPPLMADIMRRRLADPTPLKQLPGSEADDPKLVAPRLAPRSPPQVEDILRRRHVRRFGQDQPVV